ncbi:MAG: type II toxin-antitoxin system VapC family toxin [Candidatus Diapherotrites archaeon]
MNVLVDSYGWIEYFSNGPLANKYAKFIEKANKEKYFTPSIILFETYKQIKLMANEQKALEAIGYIIGYTTIIDLDKSISLEASDISIELKLGMADAIIKATAEKTNAKIVSSDKHFQKFKETVFVK